MCDVLHHNRIMIISFRHKGLRLFFETGSTRGIHAAHAAKLARVLSFLDRASVPEDVNLPLAIASLKGRFEWLLVDCR